MFIKEFNTPAMACSGISIGSYVRKGNILLCESDYVDVERLSHLRAPAADRLERERGSRMAIGAPAGSRPAPH